jgi:hypothetical protein
MQTAFNKVNGARLVFTPAEGDPWELPISSFNVSFAVNELPLAVVKPALGVDFVKGNLASLVGIKESLPTKLYFTRNGAERLLFKGFVHRVSASDNTSIFNRWLTAEISLRHQAFVLAGAPTLSYLYARRGEPLITSQHLSPYRINPLWQGTAEAGATSAAVLYQAVSSELKPNGTPLQNYPGTVLQFLVRKTVESNAPALSAAAQNLVRLYGPANLSRLPVTAQLLIWLYQSWMSSLNSNVWSALQTTANRLLFTLLPYNSGLWLANPLSLLQAPNVVLRAHEIVNLTQALEAREFPEPIDGVVLRAPVPYVGDPGAASEVTAALQSAQGIWRFVYPPAAIGGSASMADKINGDRYYHYLDMPEWVSTVPNMYLAAVAGKDGKSVAPAEALTQTGTVYSEIGTALAREMYAQFKIYRAALELMLPWREDLMPGTVVKVEDVPAETISFLGNSMYGMIRATSFSCDVVQNSPTLSTKIQLVAVRSKEDNQSPPTGYGLESSALFEAPWVGMDIQGQLLAEVPEHKAFKAQPAAHSTVP